MTTEQSVSVGRIVHVQRRNGDCRPAIVTRIYETGICNVRVFRDPYDEPEDPPEALSSIGPASESVAGAAVSGWHWPERA